MSGVPPRLDTGTLAAGGALSPGTSMPKLDSPFVDEDRTTDIPWYLLIVNLRKLTMPTGFPPGTYMGITVNAYGQVTDIATSGAIINNPVVNNPTINNGTWTNPTLSGGSWSNATINTVTITGTATAPTPTLGDNSTLISTTAFVKGQNYITDAPIDGARYCRQNGAWVAF